MFTTFKIGTDANSHKANRYDLKKIIYLLISKIIRISFDQLELIIRDVLFGTDGTSKTSYFRTRFFFENV